MSDVVLPHLDWEPTTAFSSRHGSGVSMVVVHRWGVSAWEGERIQGVVNYFKNPANQVSSHFVYAGEQGPDAGKCVQMVKLSDKSWTEASFNSVGVSIESSDRIWLGDDVEGLRRLARIVGWLLHKYQLPPVALEGAAVLTGKGFVRHGALGQNGGGHTLCPVSTPKDHIWRTFCKRVRYEADRGHFRREWAR